MMDCDTTGIEPDISLVKYKKLVGGGVFKIVNNTVPLALKKLGYAHDDIQRIVDYINDERHDRRRAGSEGRAPPGLRLRVQAHEGHAHDPLHGPRQDDGRRAAVPLGRDLEDGQHARRTRPSRRSRRPTSKRGRWG